MNEIKITVSTNLTRENELMRVTNYKMFKIIESLQPVPLHKRLKLLENTRSDHDHGEYVLG